MPYPVKLDTIGAARMESMHGGKGEDRVGAVVEIAAGGWGFMHVRLR